MSNCTPWLTSDHVLGEDLNEGLVAPDAAWVWGDPRAMRGQTHTTLGGAFWVGPRAQVHAFAQALAADSSTRALKRQTRKLPLETPKAVAMWCPANQSYALVGALSNLHRGTSDEVLRATSRVAQLSQQHGHLLKLTDAQSTGSLWMFVTALGWSFDALASTEVARWKSTQAAPALRLAFATSKPSYWDALRAQLRKHSPELLAVHNASALEESWQEPTPWLKACARL